MAFIKNIKFAEELRLLIIKQVEQRNPVTFIAEDMLRCEFHSDVSSNRLEIMVIHLGENGNHKCWRHQTFDDGTIDNKAIGEFIKRWGGFAPKAQIVTATIEMWPEDVVMIETKVYALDPDGADA